jgi:pantothenate kinase
MSKVLHLDASGAATEIQRQALLLLGRPGRKAIGIAGGPGAGKSTLALCLVAAVNRDVPGIAAYVPMDGFHMQHARLVALGIDRDKGKPHTFEALKFVAFLERLIGAQGMTVRGPGYSRKIEDVVEDAIAVGADARLLVVEGNYLLLEEHPWELIRPLLDLVVHIDVPRHVARQRLLRRHAEEGLFSQAHINAHLEHVDLPNYDLVRRSRERADTIIEIATAC